MSRPLHFSFTPRSITTRLVFSFLAVSLVPLAAVLYMSLTFANNILTEKAIETSSVQAQQHTAELEATLTQIRNDVLFLSNTPPIQGIIRATDNGGTDPTDNSSLEDWKSRLATIFIEKERSNNLYLQLRYLDAQGNEVVRVERDNNSVSRTPEDKLQFKGDRYYVAEALQQAPGEIYTSPIDLNREGTPPTIQVPHTPVLRIATPIIDQEGQQRGVVMVNVDAGSLVNTFPADPATHAQHKQEITVDQDGYYIQTAEKDRLWGSPTNLNTGQRIHNDYPDVADDLLSGSAQTILLAEETISTVPLFFDPQRTDRFWVVLEIIPTAESFAAINQLRTRMGILAILVTLLITILSYLISRTIANPILALQRGAETIQEGDLDHLVGTDTPDEIGQLSRTIDAMTAAIKESQQEVEEKVQEQTLGIATQKEKLETQQKAIINILEDVEDEKEYAEKLATDLQKFQLAVASATDGIVFTSADAEIVYVNNAWQQITGYSEKEALGQNPRLLKSGKTPQAVYDAMWNTIKKGKPFITEDIVNKRKNGTEYNAQLSIYPITGDDGTVELFVGIEQDITKRKQIDQAKTEFVSLASHQLRTPLSTINWYAELLLDGDAGEVATQQREYLEEIYKGNQRMVQLVNALLNVSRIELGTFSVEPEELRVAEIAEQVLKELQPQIEKKRLQLHKDIEDIPPMQADPNLMNIVFQNLLSNAVKYTPEEGSVSLTVKTIAKGIPLHHQTVGEESLFITVTDTGYGIPENQQKEIFSKLFRADNVQQKDTEGTGLGLYIIKSIIEHSHGTVWFESKENEGTSFHVLMPLTGMASKEGSKRLS